MPRGEGLLSQLADGITRRYWLGDNGTRRGTEVIAAVEDRNSYARAGIKISNIYTWKVYPAGRIGPPGGIISEIDVTIAPQPNEPAVAFYFVWLTLQE